MAAPAERESLLAVDARARDEPGARERRRATTRGVFATAAACGLALGARWLATAPREGCARTPSGVDACASAARCEREACRSRDEIPRVVWMLWDAGWSEDAAPPYARRARRSWIEYNPDFEVRALNMSEAMALSGTHEEGSAYRVERATWDALRVEHKADLLRCALLAKYGGVWADASLQANAGLSEWLDLRRQAHLLMRTDDSARRAKHAPWFAVWFIAASKDSYVLKRLAKEFYADINSAKKDVDYFHMAHVIARLWNEDAKFRAALGPFRSANPAHCMGGDPRLSPILKRCSRAVLHEPFNMTAELAWKYE